MNVQIIAAIIALTGVAISLFANLYLTRFNSKKEELKLKTSLIQNYNLTIIEERVKYYPAFHYLTSEMVKTLKSGSMNIGRSEISLDGLKKFREAIDDLDSKHSILFSIEASSSCKHLRKYVYNQIQIKQAEGEWSFSENDINNFHSLLGHFELCLKKDLGLFIIEFDDTNNKIKINTYEDLRTKLNATKK